MAQEHRTLSEGEEAPRKRTLARALRLVMDAYASELPLLGSLHIQDRSGDSVTKKSRSAPPLGKTPGATPTEVPTAHRIGTHATDVGYTGQRVTAGAGLHDYAGQCIVMQPITVIMST